MQALGPFIGMSQKPHPSHIKGEYLQYAEDVDFARNTIAAVRSDRLISTDKGQTIYADKCCIKTYPACIEIAQSHFDCGRVFAGSHLKDTTTKQAVTATFEDWCAGAYCKMGWPCLLKEPSVIYANNIKTDRIAEGRSYIYTYINKFGEESQASLPSDLSMHDFSTSAYVYDFEPIPPEYCAVYIKIYALVAGLSSTVGGGTEGNDEYLLVATLPISQIAFTHDPLTQPFGNALMTDEYVPVPDDASDFWHYGTSQLAFRSQGDIRFTEPYNYSLAPLKYSYRPQADLLRIAATQQFIYMLTCSQPEVLDSKVACDMSGARASSVVNDSFPLIGRQSVATHENSVIFASVTGLVHLNSSNAMVVTEDIFTQAQWDALQPQTMIGVVYNGYYYGATATCTFRFEMARGPKSGYAEKFSYLSIRPTAFRVTDDDRLLYTDATGLHELGQGYDFKTYKAITKDFYEPNQAIHGVMRVTSEHGDITIQQTTISDCKAEKTISKNIKCGGIYRWKKRLGAGVRYILTGKAEVSSLYFGSSISSITGRS
jgi:hypothetical protein